MKDPIIIEVDRLEDDEVQRKGPSGYAPFLYKGYVDLAKGVLDYIADSDDPRAEMREALQQVPDMRAAYGRAAYGAIAEKVNELADAFGVNSYQTVREMMNELQVLVDRHVTGDFEENDV